MSLLSLNNIHKSYPQGDKKIEVLSGVGLELEQGRTLAIIGQSGSGKSTLLSILCGIEKPDSGEHFFDGTNFVQLSEDEKTKLRARDIGIIFQQFHLLPHLTALENVMLVLEILGESESDAQKKCLELLEKVGLSHRLHHYPAQLSGGEKQRVAIARSMIIEPKLILADEPSGSLDQDTGDDIMHLLFTLVKEKNLSLILVTHNQELARRCDETKMLSRGHFSHED